LNTLSQRQVAVLGGLGKFVGAAGVAGAAGYGLAQGLTYLIGKFVDLRSVSEQTSARVADWNAEIRQGERTTADVVAEVEKFNEQLDNILASDAPENIKRFAREARIEPSTIEGYIDTAAAVDDVGAAAAGAVPPVADLADAQEALASEADKVRARQEELATATQRASDATERQEQFTRDVAQAHRDAAQAARDQVNAQLSLAGGFLGIRGASLQAQQAQQRLADARNNITRLERRGKVGTIEYRDALTDLQSAQLDAAGGQLSVAQAVAQFVNEARSGTASQKEARSLVAEFGAKAGLSAGEIANLTSNVQGLIGTYNQIPAGKETVVEIEDEEARRRIARLKRELAEIEREIRIKIALEQMNEAELKRAEERDAAATARSTSSFANAPITREEAAAAHAAGTPTVQVIMDGRKIQESQGRDRVLLGGG